MGFCKSNLTEDYSFTWVHLTDAYPKWHSTYYQYALSVVIQPMTLLCYTVAVELQVNSWTVWSNDCYWMYSKYLIISSTFDLYLIHSANSIGRCWNHNRSGLEEHLHWWPFKESCVFSWNFVTNFARSCSKWKTKAILPVFWIRATSFVTAALSLLPTMFSERTLKLYAFPITRSEIVTLSLWKCSRTVNQSCQKQ